MTDPRDDPDQPVSDEPDNDAARPDDVDVARPDDATVERLRALLRDEPVDDDELARERRIRAALIAAEHVDTPAVEVPGTAIPTHAAHSQQQLEKPDAPATARVPSARRGAPRRWLVAAAILSVLGIGGYLVITPGSASNDQNASDNAAMATEDRSGADDESVARDAGPESTGRALAQDAVPTTVPGMGQESPEAPSAAGFDASVSDLGRVESLDAAVAAAEILGPGDTAGAATSRRRVLAGPALRCLDQQRAFELEVLAVATLDGRDVLVVRSPTGPLVLDAASCRRSGP